MDKGTYETYEFLPTNNVGTEADQFFVMQDDGTFIVTKQIQYVTQQQENKPIVESTDTCTVFDVPAQQFYVNVNGSTEFIVPEQLILPEGANNLYTSSYLLQSEPITTTNEQIEENATEQYKETNTEVAVEPNNKQTNNCTEITLSDEQYQTLEQKGWILLEANDKIFVLNTLGLHDITTNDKLIHKLKNEIQNNANVDIDAGCLKADHVPHTSQDPVSNQASVEFVVANDDVTENNTQNVCFDVVDKEDTGDEQVNDESFDEKNNIQSPSAAIQNETIEVFREQDSNSIKIKTKFIFDNIPNKIILGKTASGKRIIAKVVKKKPQPVPDKIAENKQLGGPDIDEAQFLGLVHQALRSYSSTFFAEDVPAANGVIVQLLKVPALRQSIIDKNIIVTKIRTTKGNDNEMHKSNISLLTGKVKISNDNKECFTHIPNLLHNLLSTRGPKDNNNTKISKATNISDGTINTNDLSIFHIHVSEVVCEDNLVRVHINLAKRQFAVDSVINYKQRKPQTMYACGSCATVFKTPQALEEHQEGQCLEVADNLTIDIDVINKNKETYAIIKNGKDKLYSCLQCDATFPRISHCQKHVKTHFAPSPLKTDSEKGDSEQMDTDKEKEIYKCKMCPATFYHPSTLSRHIVTRHIKLKTN